MKFLSRITRTQRALIAVVAAAAAVGLTTNCGDTGAPPAKSQGTTKITVASAATGVDTPLDATPDPMGNTIYFIASAGAAKAIYSVPAGGGSPTQLYMGAPLVDPQGISVSSDGKTIYVADHGAGASGGGAILSMPSGGDTPVVVTGTEGTKPTALDVFEQNSADAIYFAGDKGGAPSVFKISAAGGTATTLASGAPLQKPYGVTVATNGTVYVADEQAGMSQPGQVFSIIDSKVAKLGGEVDPGNPMGIAVTLDDSKVLVSSLDPGAKTSMVNIFASKDGSVTTFNDTIKQNTVSGGLHRARFKDVYAWAGKTQVYYIGIKVVYADSSTPGGVGIN